MTIKGKIHSAAPDGVSVNIGLVSLLPADLACFRDGGYLIHEIDLSMAASRDDLFRLISEKLDFPKIATNFDGLYDWLGDLGWFDTTAGHVLVFSGLDTLLGTLPEIIGPLCAVCIDAASTMRRGGKGFHVFLLSSSPGLVTRLAQAAATENEWQAEAAASGRFTGRTGPVLLLSHDA